MVELGARNDNVMIGLRLADVRARRGDNEGARAVLAAELDARERYPEENAMLRIGAGRAHVSHRRRRRRRGSWPTRRCDELRAEARAPSRAGPRPRDGAQARRHARAFEGDREAAEPLLIEAYAVALATQDMPIVAIGRRRVAALATHAAYRSRAPRSSAPLRACAAPRIRPTPRSPD